MVVEKVEPGSSFGRRRHHQNADGRYCLNDLHKAAGAEKRHGQSHWLETEQSKALAHVLSDTVNPVSVIKEGKGQGSFVAKEMVYAYANWISAPPNFKSECSGAGLGLCAAALPLVVQLLNSISGRKRAEASGNTPPKVAKIIG